MNTFVMAVTPEEIERILNELEASRASRKRAWEILQDLRRLLKATPGVQLPPPSRKTIDAEGTIIIDAVRQAIRQRTIALEDLLKAISGFRKCVQESEAPLGANYAQAVQHLNKAIDRTDRLL